MLGDEGTREVHWLRRLLARPELGAVAGTLLVLAFFIVTAGDSGLFSAKGIVNFLEVSAQLGILAVAVTLLMIAGEFDLSVGSMIGFAGIVIAIPAAMWGWPVWTTILLAFASCRIRRLSQRIGRRANQAAILHRHARQPVRTARTDPRPDAAHHRAYPGLRAA